MKTIIVQILDAEKAADAFEVLVDALGEKNILAMSFECESTKEAADRLAELAKKDAPATTDSNRPHVYKDDEMYGGCF